MVSGCVKERLEMPKKSKASKNKAKTFPKLFNRGPKEIYYFRMFVNGKDTWISTGTTDLEKAQEKQADIIEGKDTLKFVSKVEKDAGKLAHAFVKSITQKDIERIRLGEAYKKWADKFPSYSDISSRLQASYSSIFRRFVEWAKQKKNLIYVDEISNDIALEFARHLWDSKISPKTYNDHLKLLSRIFSAIDAITPLANRDPFDRRKIQRKRKAEMATVHHEALEPAMIKAVIAEAANHGIDFRDLIILGAQTGMRLKDAALLEWKFISKGFIEITPYKTCKTGSTAKIPVTGTLQKILVERKALSPLSKYVLPSIAEHYLKNTDFVTKKAKDIFETALGEKNVNMAPGKHRRRTASLYSFHSLRTTFMSLLAQKDVSPRDAMRIMGWDSPEMIQIYERELEKARGDADARTTKIVNSISELNFEIPECVIQKKLSPEKDALNELTAKYSNVTIGKIYDISSTAIKKWLDKFGIVRANRIESADLSDKDIEAIRQKLIVDK